MKYIRRVEVAAPGTRSEHIVAVQYSYAATGTLVTCNRDAVVREIDSGTETYRSHDDRTGAEAHVETRPSAHGPRYITTVANGRATDNLLHLQRFSR